MKLFITLLVSIYGILSLDAKFIPDKRIVNGYPGSAKLFPYQVGLEIQLNDKEVSKCGGSLINAKNVLTAAHCFGKLRNGIASFGSDFYMGGKLVEFSSATLHKRYNSISQANDIAIIHLDEAVRPNGKTIAYITLEANRFPDNEEITISGFGFITDTQDTDELYFAKMSSIPNSSCRRNFPDLLQTMLCCRGLNSQATCVGDSGGPAVYYDEKTGEALQVGVLSFGAESCEEGFPDVFTRVSDYIDWIEDNVK